MPVLVLSPRLTSDSQALAAAALQAGWEVERLENWRPPERLRSQDVALYGEALKDRGWAVVEANGVWASGICGAEPAKVLPVLARATLRRAAVADTDLPRVRPPAEIV